MRSRPCRKAGVVFAVGNNKRCFPSMQELRRVVAEGQIGEVLHIEAHFCNEHSARVVPGGWRDDPAESPGGGLTGAGLHLIDALVSLGGPIAEVHARLFERKPPPDPRDVIALQVTFANGGTGSSRACAPRRPIGACMCSDQGLGRGARRD